MGLDILFAVAVAVIFPPLAVPVAVFLALWWLLFETQA